MNLNPVLNDILCCPACHTTLVTNDNVLTCSQCSYEYKVINNIPLVFKSGDLSLHVQQQIDYFEKEKITADEEYTIYPWQQSYINRLFDNMPANFSGLGLDCGTGSGYLAIALAQKGYTVVATDITLKSLHRLAVISKKLNIEDKILLVCCDSQSLPFKDNKFALFISNAVFEHLPKEKEAIDEMTRTTISNAFAMVTTPLRYKFLNPLLLPVNMLHDKLIGHLRRYDETDYYQRFSAFSVKRAYYTGHTVKVLKVLLNRLINIFAPSVKPFDEIKMEIDDAKSDTLKSFASNITVLLQKKIDSAKS